MWCTWRAGKRRRWIDCSPTLPTGCEVSWCVRTAFSPERWKRWKTLARSSATPSGGRCTRLLHWCRALKSDWIYCVPAAAGAIRIPRSSAKKSCSSSAVLSRFQFLRQAHKGGFAAFLLAEPAAAQYAVAVVKDRALPGGNRALRCIEGNAGVRAVQREDRGVRWNVLVANLNHRAHGNARGFMRDPIYVLHFARCRAQRLVIPDNHAIVLAIDGKHVERLASGKSQALALSNRELVHPVVSADHDALLVNHLATAIRQRRAALPGIGFDELHIIAARHEAELHAFRFVSNRQVCAACRGAYLVLGQFPQRELAARQLVLRESPEKIGLVLAVVARAKQFPPLGPFILADARVVAGGQPLRSDLPRHAQERLELHVSIAVGAGHGGASREILIDERAHHSFFKLLLKIDDIVRELEMLRHALRVVNVIKRAAAVLYRTVALQLGQAALVPKLHSKADHRTALLLQQCRDGGTVHTSAHGHGDQAGLDLAACGQGIELCGGSHLLILRENRQKAFRLRSPVVVYFEFMPVEFFLETEPVL